MAMQRYVENGVYIVQCDDTTDIDSRKESRSNVQNRMHAIEHDGHARRARAGDKWFGGSCDDITRALEQGWPEGQERVQRIADEMRGTMAAPKSYRRRQRWSEDGDEPSWEREQSGYTDIWRTSRRDVMTGPTTVDLLSPWSHSAMYGAEQIMWNGVVLAVLVDLLEEAGYRVGATLTNSLHLYEGGGMKLLGLVTVKLPQNPLDMASLVPVVVHPGAYRWHGIAFASLAPVNCGGGHGMPIPVTAVPKVAALPKNGIVLESVYSEQAARAEIMRVLALFESGHPHLEG